MISDSECFTRTAHRINAALFDRDINSVLRYLAEYMDKNGITAAEDVVTAIPKSTGRRKKNG